MGIITNIFLIIFTLIVFLSIVLIHELGHFFAAKASGIRVNEFAIGMGPSIFSFKKAETKYSLKLLPIGGYCAMEGEDENSDKKDAFNNKSIFARIITIAAGATMNIVLGFVLSFVITVQAPRFATTKIVKFENEAISNSSGLQVDDSIKFINGYRIRTLKDLSFAIATRDSSKKTEFVVTRDGKDITLADVKLPVKKIEGKDKEYTRRDFYLETVPKNFLNVFSETYKDVISTVRLTWGGLAKLLRGELSIKDMSGPVGIISETSKAASEGLKTSVVDAINNVIVMMTLITINLGVLNLLPLPALDGGRLIFLVLEAIRRKPVPAKYEGFIHTAGFCLLMVTMILFTFFDVMKFFGKG